MPFSAFAFTADLQRNHDGTYLEHDAADVVNALGDGVSGAGHRHSPLCRVGQHLTGHLWTEKATDISEIQ